MASNFLTTVSTTYKHNNSQELKPARTENANRDCTSPQAAVEILQNRPDYESLTRVLRLLAHGRLSTISGPFRIGNPSPEAAQIVQLLVAEIAPNYWRLLREDSASRDYSKSAPDQDPSLLGLFLSCLGNLTGLKAILVRLRALIQDAKAGATKPRRPGVALNLALTLELLGGVLEGEDRVRQIWRSTTDEMDNPVRRNPISQELLTVLAGGTVVSLSAEAATIVTHAHGPTEPCQSWLADGSTYSTWLARNLAQWMRSQPLAGQAELCSSLLTRGSRLGHPAAMIKHIFERLVLSRDATPQTFRLLVHPMSRTEQRKVLFATLQILSADHLDRLGRCETESSRAVISAAAGAILSILDPQHGGTEHLITWLTASAGAGVGEGPGIRRAVMAVVARDRDALADVLEKSLGRFGDPLHVKHCPILQQEAHAQILILCAGYVSRSTPQKLRLALRSGEWLRAISNRLAASNRRAQFLGLVVGEALSSLTDGQTKPLDFHMDEAKTDEGTWYKSLSRVSDAVGVIEPLLAASSQEASRPPAAASATVHQEKAKAKRTERSREVPMHILRRPQQACLVEEVEDDGIAAYAKPDSDSEDSDDDPTLVRASKPRAPVYIRDLIQYLRDTENYNHQKLALHTAPTLIRRKAGCGTEVSEFADELASLLVGLSDKHDTPELEELRIQGMVSLVVAQPAVMGPWFTRTFFDGDYSLNQRASILVVLGMSARELAGHETSTYKDAASFPSKALPGRVERLYRSERSGSGTSGVESPFPGLRPLRRTALDRAAQDVTARFLAPLAAEAAETATDPKALKMLSQNDTRLCIKSRARPRVRAIPNTTAQLLATSFFAPLTARFQAALHSPAARTRGIVFQPALLALYIQTLALIVHAAGPSTLALSHMTVELWQLVLGPAVRARCGAGELDVLGSVLFALLVLLDLNEGRMRDLCQEMGREVVETQEWVTGVVDGIRGGDGMGDEERTKTLAAGVLIRLREGLDKYRMLLVGEMIG